MSFTVRLCLVIASALLLLLCSTSCLGGNYSDCVSDSKTCGGIIEYSYPFAENGSGCGDPEFQLNSCNSDSEPRINIGGNEYRILASSYLRNNSNFKIMRIVDDNLWGNNCNFSGDYSQFWRSDSSFRINDAYTNLTLWKNCDQYIENSNGLNLNLCGDNWNYSYSNLERTPFCNAFQLPISKSLSQQSQQSLNITSLALGFNVTWHVDPTRYQRCGACLKSKGSCGYNISDPGSTFLCYCPNGTSNPDECPGNGTPVRGGRNMSRMSRIIIASCSVIGVALIAIAVLLLLNFYAKRRNRPPSSPTSKVEKFLKEYAHEMPTRYSLSHLKKITNNFAEKLGEGGYGVVYKGKFRPNEVPVAVKILDRHRHGEAQFMNEVATIGRVHHVNLVRLLGYCFESPTSALVYEYMANGSLDKFLFAGKETGQVLKWEQMYSIALGAARGIAYLHHDCEKRIIHFDIKPHNILLDAEFTPKVADFGLAKFCGKGEDHISMTAGRGTPGYVAPELCDKNLGSVTEKSDVYSFGMLLLEIVGGRKNIQWKVSRSSQFYFPEWAFKMLESGELGLKLRGGMETKEEEMAERLTKIGLWCIQYNYVDRPAMSRVVQMLEGNGEDVPSPPSSFNFPGPPEKPQLFSMERSRSI
jgi:hypothetical protein